MYDLLMYVFGVAASTGGFMGLYFLLPRRWIFTKVRLMVSNRWGNGLGDMDMYNKFWENSLWSGCVGIGDGICADGYFDCVAGNGNIRRGVYEIDY